MELGQSGKIPTGRPQLRFKNVCKRDLQALGINTDCKELLPNTEMPGDIHCKTGVITI